MAWNYGEDSTKVRRKIGKKMCRMEGEVVVRYEVEDGLVAADE
jgi:hypothetical protein